MRYFLHVAYDGSKYSGWQRQPKARSIQEKIEDKLLKVFKEPITVFGCGRTDKGVHASQYIMHINLSKALDFDLKFRLNKNLPDEIAVYDVIEMKEDQHCRYDASSRTYDYFIHLNKDPHLANYSSFYQLENLDFESMKKAAALLAQYDDFRAICKQPDLYPNTICKVSHAELFVNEEEGRLRFTITANRFLRGMIRLSITFLLKIGKGEITLDEFEHILANKIVLPYNSPSLPNGLYLSKIEYPYLKLTPRKDICYFLKMGLE